MVGERHERDNRARAAARASRPPRPRRARRARCGGGRRRHRGHDRTGCRVLEPVGHVGWRRRELAGGVRGRSVRRVRRVRRCAQARHRLRGRPADRDRSLVAGRARQLQPRPTARGGWRGGVGRDVLGAAAGRNGSAQRSHPGHRVEHGDLPRVRGDRLGGRAGGARAGEGSPRHDPAVAHRHACGPAGRPLVHRCPSGRPVGRARGRSPADRLGHRRRRGVVGAAGRRRPARGTAGPRLGVLLLGRRRGQPVGRVARLRW